MACGTSSIDPGHVFDPYSRRCFTIGVVSTEVIFVDMVVGRGSCSRSGQGLASLVQPRRKPSRGKI